MNLQTSQYIRELDSQFEATKKVEDEEVKSMLTKFLCVRTSGLLENFIKSLISDYADKKVPKEIKRYISGKMREIKSLKCTKIEDILKSFSLDWGDEFSDYLKDHDQQKNSLDSIVANRHNIAHGQSSGMSFTNMQQYYDDVKSLIAKLDTIIR